MKLTHSAVDKLVQKLILLAILTFSFNSLAATVTLIDNFNHSSTTSGGIPRIIISDGQMGGKSSATQTVTDGQIQVLGELVPPRGQPGWISTVLPLGQINQNFDASAFEGIELLIRVNKGTVTVSANSTEITNFDYHSAILVLPSDGEFHQVKVPFASMKRFWSEQTTLNTKTLNSISLVAASPQKTSFDFEIDEINFY